MNNNVKQAGGLTDGLLGMATGAVKGITAPIRDNLAVRLEADKQKLDANGNLAAGYIADKAILGSVIGASLVALGYLAKNLTKKSVLDSPAPLVSLKRAATKILPANPERRDTGYDFGRLPSWTRPVGLAGGVGLAALSALVVKKLLSTEQKHNAQSQVNEMLAQHEQVLDKSLAASGFQIKNAGVLDSIKDSYLAFAGGTSLIALAAGLTAGYLRGKKNDNERELQELKDANIKQDYMAPAPFRLAPVYK